MINSTITITRTQQTATVNINGEAQIAPSNSIAPTISPSGVQPVGTLFTASVGTWVGTLPITYEYRWTRNGTPINLATNSTYTSVNADEGSTIRCEVRATNDYGTSSFVASSNSSLCGAVPVNTVAPTLTPSGSQVTGTVITLGNGTWTGTSPITYEYRWTRDNVVINGETANTYTILAGDDGTVIKGQVRATNAAGVSAYVTTSNQVDAVDSALDPDAEAFLIAAGITDPTITDAINTLVVDMKGYGVWTKMKAIYPMVGGTATTHKYNLKDPRDLDAAFRLQFFGSWTHSPTGALPNGSNAYADTYFNPSTNFALTSCSMSYYNRTNTALGYDMGAFDGSGGDNMIASRYTGTTDAYTSFGAGYTSASTSAIGLIMGCNISNTENLYKNGTQIATQSREILYVNLTITLAASNRIIVPTEFTDHECAFSSIGDGLTDTEAANFYTAVQAFQTILNRQIP
jgi:hypothetical protein